MFDDIACSIMINDSLYYGRIVVNSWEPNYSLNFESLLQFAEIPIYWVSQ
jgi:hypothetical protein